MSWIRLIYPPRRKLQLGGLLIRFFTFWLMLPNNWVQIYFVVHYERAIQHIFRHSLHLNNNEYIIGVIFCKCWIPLSSQTLMFVAVMDWNWKLDGRNPTESGQWLIRFNCEREYEIRNTWQPNLSNKSRSKVC